MIRLRWWLSAVRDPAQLYAWASFAWSYVTAMAVMIGPLEVLRGWLDLAACPQCATAVAAAHAANGHEPDAALLREWAFLLAMDNRSARTVHPGKAGWCGLRAPPPPEEPPTPEELDRREAEEAEQERRRRAIFAGQDPNDPTTGRVGFNGLPLEFEDPDAEGALGPVMEPPEAA